jgi:IS1 family transposase
MNKLSTAQRAKILHLLCEGMSIRSITRTEQVGKNTVIRLMLDAGEACAAYHDEHVRNLPSKRIQCDEIWSFIAAKQKNVSKMKAPVDGAGVCWTWTGLCVETKMIVSYFIGDRSGQSAMALMDDLRGRLAKRVQLTTDGHKAYLEAVEGAFGADIDYAQLIKVYGASADGSKGRYSPAECVGIIHSHVEGKPDPKYISTSYVERSNLTLRMQNRRFTRLTNGFSKKLENHAYSVALFSFFYNFCRIHKTLRVTPAMAAGVSKTLWEVSDIVALVEAQESKQAPTKRGPYKKALA